MEEEKTNNLTVNISADTEEIEKKLERIKKLLDDIKISAQEVKELFKHLF